MHTNLYAHTTPLSAQMAGWYAHKHLCNSPAHGVEAAAHCSRAAGRARRPPPRRRQRESADPAAFVVVVVAVLMVVVVVEVVGAAAGKLNRGVHWLRDSAQRNPA